MGDVVHIGPTSLGVSLKLPLSFVALAETFGLTAPDLARERKVFGFHRERRDGVWGWRIELTIGKLTLIAPWTDDMPFPRRRAEAEAWAYHFAMAHGFEPLKHGKPPRRRRPLRVIQGGRATSKLQPHGGGSEGTDGPHHSR